MDKRSILADLLRQRNLLDSEIGTILDRPVTSGHLGEYVAGIVFGITLNPSASTKGHDGFFQDGVLAGKTVNVKYGTRLDGLLNLVASENPTDHPDFYLVMSGPRTPASGSRGTFAPWVDTCRLPV